MKKIIPDLKINLFLFLLTTCISILIPKILLSQGNISNEFSGNTNTGSGHQADRWYFGQNAGLDFRTQDPVVDLTNYLLNVPTSPAIMADSLGNILFFTDGVKVFNNLDQIMPNGDGLHGFVGYPMPVLIVPKPGPENKYFIFTTHRPQINPNDPGPFYGLEYNEVDLNLNEGYGDVTVKNKVLLQPEVCSKLTSVRHSNGMDYWVVAHKFNSSEFCAFRVNSSGVDTLNYMSSLIGTVHAAPGETNNAIGYMKISPDGTKLALTIYGSGICEVFNFDASTGQVTNAITSPPIFDDAYGIEFSPDSRFLYSTITSISMPLPGNTPPSYLFQFDVSLGASMFNAYDTIASDTSGSYFGGTQLGTDGRIYISRSPYGNGALSVIQNPKRKGQACNFVSNAIDLQGKSSRFGFPNFIQSYFNLPHFNTTRTAFGDTTFFTLQNNSNIDEVFWQFGDPASGSNTSSDMQPGHVFSAPGAYQVQVTEYFNGIEYATYINTVEIINYQQISDCSVPSFYSIYPNPGDRCIRLIFTKEMKEAVISVKNMVGQQVWGPVVFDDLQVNKEVRIELPDLPEGVFMVQVNSQNADSYVSRYILKR
jgi:PKD repeat protein